MVVFPHAKINIGLFVREEDLHQLAIDAFNDVCTGGNPRPTSIAEIEALYHKAY